MVARRTACRWLKEWRCHSQAGDVSALLHGKGNVGVKSVAEATTDVFLLASREQRT
jgi:hypothetical protein